jgi:F-type H+-transporting ATPase subunit alpha
MTALPIVETEQGEIAAYIPTNLISITDGQIYLDPALYARGFLPAIDITRSVSRIGGKAQLPAIKAEAGRMKLDFLQFLELEVFTRFGSRLEAGVDAKSGAAGCCGNSSNRNASPPCRRNSSWRGW